MVIVKATKLSEAGGPPDPKMFAEMGKFNDELKSAGILLDCDGLHPSSKGYRVQRTTDGKREVVRGPFGEKDLIAGYWFWQVKSMEEAVEWVLRCPDPMPGQDSEIEIRRIHEMEELDLG